MLLREGNVPLAGKQLVKAKDAYDGFRALCRQHDVEKQPDLLDDYESHCTRVLEAFTPRVAPGKHVVRTLERVIARLPRRRPRHPGRTLAALDAVITAGQSAPDQEIDQRVVRELARMLRARVLFHYAAGRYLSLEHQRRHTLSTWTMRRLVCDDEFLVKKVRRRPEFWRPEQRRPGGVIRFAVGRGVACLARKSPFRNREARAVRTVLRFLAERREKPQAPLTVARDIRGRRTREPRPIEGLVGTSRPWRRTLRNVWRFAPTDCSVIVLGETGTGKEGVARALHLASERAQGPFITVNCGAVHTETLASTLFGHVRGAFTGADRPRRGLFVAAHRGTLFFDELSEMPYDMQTALLRVLEERTILPLGATKPRRIDVRIVSATHSDIDAAVATGRLRSDLVHRLDVARLVLPPLRERMSDLPLLTSHLLARAEIAQTMHMDALEALARHTWPGNVRELDNVLRAAALLSDGPVIEPAVVEHVLDSRRRAQASAPRLAAPLTPRAREIVLRMGDRWCSTPELAAELGVSPRTINRELAEMLDSGLVEAFGRARARRYRACRDSSGFGVAQPEVH